MNIFTINFGSMVYLINCIYNIYVKLIIVNIKDKGQRKQFSKNFIILLLGHYFIFCKTRYKTLDLLIYYKA